MIEYVLVKDFYSVDLFQYALSFIFFLGLQVDRVQLACQKESEWLDM